MKPIDAFNYIDPYVKDKQKQSHDLPDDIGSLSIGAGSKAMYVDQSGMRLGAKNASLAPFSVDMNGNVTASSLTVNNGTISGGTITGSAISAATITGTSISGGTITGTTINGGTITGATLKLGGAANGNGLLKLYNASNVQVVQMDNGGITVAGTSAGIAFLDTIGGTSYGAITPAASGQLELGSLSNKDLTLYGDKNLNFLVGSGTITMQGHSFVIGSNTAIVDNGGGVAGITCGGGVKNAIVPTSKGYRALYTNESPNVWFMDFCYGKKKRKWPKFWEYTWEIKADPLFLETVVAPFMIVPTGIKDTIQLWGIRKGFEKTRFEEKTKKEFIENNKFWDTPREKAKVDFKKKK